MNCLARLFSLAALRRHALLLALLLAAPLFALRSGNFYYSVSNGEATITGFSDSYSGDLTIPSTLGGYPVTSIGEEAFEGCSSLTSVTIPEGVGEVMLAKYMGKKKVIAETGVGQHSVAMATAAVYFGLPCDIYMGEVDVAKQHPNVLRMQILGANVIPVSRGQRTLKEAVDAAFEAYLQDPENTMFGGTIHFDLCCVGDRRWTGGAATNMVDSAICCAANGGTPVEGLCCRSEHAAEPCCKKIVKNGFWAVLSKERGMCCRPGDVETIQPCCEASGGSWKKVWNG